MVIQLVPITKIAASTPHGMMLPETSMKTLWERQQPKTKNLNNNDKKRVLWTLVKWTRQEYSEWSWLWPFQAAGSLWRETFNHRGRPGNPVMYPWIPTRAVMCQSLYQGTGSEHQQLSSQSTGDDYGSSTKRFFHSHENGVSKQLQCSTQRCRSSCSSQSHWNGVPHQLSKCAMPSSATGASQQLKCSSPCVDIAPLQQLRWSSHTHAAEVYNNRPRAPLLYWWQGDTAAHRSGCWPFDGNSSSYNLASHPSRESGSTKYSTNPEEGVSLKRESAPFMETGTRHNMCSTHRWMMRHYGCKIVLLQLLKPQFQIRLIDRV